MQAGRQLEHLTGGKVMAGFHEVVINSDTTKVISQRKEQGKSLWRVSSTLFGHIQSDQMLEPLHHFRNEISEQKFPPILAGNQVSMLTHFNLMNNVR